MTTKSEKQKPLQIIRAKDLQRLFDLTERTAYRRYHAIRAALGKNELQSLFLHEVMKFEGIEQ